MPFWRKYNTLLVTGTTSIRIPIIKRAVVDFALGADWTPAAGDVKVFVDAAAVANITNLPTAIASGNGAFWEFIITGAELTCKQLLVVVSDAATKAVEDQSFIVETYGNASAMYAADLSLANLPANVTQLLGTAWLTPGVAGTPDVNAKQLGAAPVTATTSVTFSAASTVASTTNITAGTITTATNVTTVNGLAANVITATSINADAITAAKVADDVSTEFANKTWDTDATGRQTLGTFGQAIGDPVADTNTIYKAVVTDATGATVGVDVVAVKVDTAAILADTGTDGVVVNAASLAADAATEIANAVWDTDATGRQTLGTFGQAIGDPVADTNTIYKATVTDATGATVGVDVVAVKAETVSLQSDTDNIQTRLPAALVGGLMSSTVTAIDGNTAAAANLKQSTLAIGTGVVGAASTTTSIVTSSMSPAAAVTDQFKGRIVSFAEDTTTVNLRGQSTDITGNTAGGVLACTALTTAPVSGDTFSVT